MTIITNLIKGKNLKSIKNIIFGKNFSPNLEECKESFKTYKKPIRLKYRKSDEEEKIKTKEGVVKCDKGDFVMTGTEGENWPIKSKTFKNTYNLLNEEYASKKKMIVKAIKMNMIFRVKVNWCEDILTGKKGDYLIEYSNY